MAIRSACKTKDRVMNQILKRFRMRDIILILVFSLGLGVALSVTGELHYSGIWNGPGQNYLRIGGRTFLKGILFSVPVFLFVCLLTVFVDRVSFRAAENPAGKLRGLRLFFLVWAVLLISWTPYFLTYYPGGVVGDGAETLEYVIRTDQLTSHWGVTQILALRLFLAIGRLFSDDVNVGIYLYALTSAVLYSGVCAAVITTLRAKGVPFPLLVLFTLIYAFFGHYASFSMCLWKDGLFGAGIVAFTLLLWVEPDDKEPKARWAVKSGLVILFICFWRNFVSYGLLAFGLLWLAFGKNKKRLIAVLMVLVSLFAIIIQGPVYQMLGIEGRRIVETLAIPLQQVAAVVNAGVPLSEDQERVLFAMMPEELWSQSYTPAISDSIKRILPGEKLTEHLADFLRIWIELMVRYPHLYLKAHLMETLGFWQPYGSNQGFYFDWFLGVQDLFQRGYERRDLIREGTGYTLQYAVQDRMDYIPSGTLAWILLLSCLLVLCRRDGRGKGMRILIPYLCCWLVVFFSAPIAYSYRYVEMLAIGFPLIVSFPFIRESRGLQPVGEAEKRHPGFRAECLSMAGCAVLAVGVLLAGAFQFYGYPGGKLEILMSGKRGNAEEYVTGGISVAEDGFRWTLGDRMDIRYPNTARAEKLTVQIHVINTFNGKQRYQALDRDGKELENGELEGPGTIRFTLYPDGEDVAFSLRFPDAAVISEVLENTDDSRKVAMQISRIEIVREE